jgi:ubiquinone/menaquinone biosynthesis C-methylase UbiE
MGMGLLSNLNFRFMAVEFRLRDLLRPPERVLAETGVGRGKVVLDYGCGPGGFSVAAAKLVGPEGRVYAVDVAPIALRYVARGAARAGVGNVVVMGADACAGLEDASVDLVLLYDVLHDLTEPHRQLGEFHRLLRGGGVLSVSDHHIAGPALVDTITAAGRFRHTGRGKYTDAFVPLPSGWED